MNGKPEGAAKGVSRRGHPARSFRPESYYSERAIFANIKGMIRKEVVLEAAATGRLPEIPAEFLDDSLPEELIRLLSAYHPGLGVGEHLPDCLKGEVEIARISAKIAPGFVISFRAVSRGERYYYRIVGEDGRRYRCVPSSTSAPLSMKEIVCMIGAIAGKRPKRASPEITMEEELWRSGAIRISSEFYPELEEAILARSCGRTA